MALTGIVALGVCDQSSSLGILVWLVDAALLACDISGTRLNWLPLLRLEDLVGVGDPVRCWLWLSLARGMPG